jgi:2-polyprenyl-3-methyl-5-hydroxy-6-metoxy-1,4-benzoquinol methylase
MLARRKLPPEYWRWNATWGSPQGRHVQVTRLVQLVAPGASAALRHRTLLARSLGPFGFQTNSSTRAFEYPWAYHQLASVGPCRVLEIGGALSGLQFVLAKEGFRVHNVDPFFDYGDGDYNLDPAARHAFLNRTFGTDVVLHRTTLPESRLSGPFDAVVCVSTIEHLSDHDIEETLKLAKDLVVPGGLLVFTVDLFLNVSPFCSPADNVYGTNISIARLQQILGAEIEAGDRNELFGFDEFSTDRVLSELDELALNDAYPQLAQLVSFRSPSH